MFLDRDPWLRSPGENDEAYAEFLIWLNAPRPRTAPHRPELASVWGWGTRAAAYDSADAKIRTTAENLKVIERSGFALVALGLEKWMRAELASPESNRASLTELMRVYATLREIKGMGIGLGDAGDLDARVAAMTPDEQDTLERAARLMRMKA